MALIRKKDAKQPVGIPSNIVEAAVTGFALQFVGDTLTKKFFPNQKKTFAGIVETADGITVEEGKGFKIPGVGMAIFSSKKPQRDVDMDTLSARVLSGEIPVDVLLALVKSVDMDALAGIAPDLVKDRPVEAGEEGAMTITFRADNVAKKAFAERLEASGLVDVIVKAVTKDVKIGVAEIVEVESKAEAVEKEAEKSRKVQVAA